MGEDLEELGGENDKNILYEKFFNKKEIEI